MHKNHPVQRIYVSGGTFPPLPAESFTTDLVSILYRSVSQHGIENKGTKLMVMLMRNECVVPLFCLSLGRLWPLRLHTVKPLCYDNTGQAQRSVGFHWLRTKLTWDLTLPV